MCFMRRKYWRNIEGEVHIHVKKSQLVIKMCSQQALYIIASLGEQVVTLLLFHQAATSQWTLSLYIYGTLAPSHKSGKKWGEVSGPYAVCRSACIMYTYVTCNIIL